MCSLEDLQPWHGVQIRLKETDRRVKERDTRKSRLVLSGKSMELSWRVNQNLFTFTLG